MDAPRQRSPTTTVLIIASLAAAYALTGLLGMKLSAPPGNVTAVWLPAGIAVAALLKLGRGVWPGVTLGSLACNLVVFPDAPLGARVAGSLSIAITSTLGPLLIAWFAERSVKHITEPSPRVLMSFAGWTLAGCAVNATGGLLATAGLAGLAPAAWPTFWGTWLAGDLLGIFIIVPLVLSEGIPLPARPLEWALTLGLTLSVCQLSFGLPIRALGAATLPLTWLLSLGVVWAGARLGSRAVSLNTLVIYAVSSWATVEGLGPFASLGRDLALVLVDSVLLVMMLIGLLLTSLAALSRSQTAALVQERSTLEARVAERGRALVAETNERARLTQKLVEAEKQEALGRLAGGVAHDFNNLLTVVSGEAELLRRVGHSEEIHDGAGAILAAAHRAGELTRQLLAVARRQPTTPQQIDLRATLATNRRLLRPLFPESVTLDIECPPDCAVNIDPTLLDQIILNLAINARDAITGNGAVRIEARKERLDDAAADALGLPPGAWVCMSVIDDGSGIPPEVLPHIFEPFFTTKAEGRGTGLGLSTVWGIAQQSRGTIRVSSAPGRTSFSVWLPFSEGEKVAETAPLPARPAAGRRATVLVVEDEPLVRRTVVLTLERAGHRTFTAADGEEGLALLRQSAQEIELVLTDVVMPRLGGVELAREVRATTRIPVVFMSGFHERQAELASERVINKPFSAEQLLDAVAAALEASAAA